MTPTPTQAPPAPVAQRLEPTPEAQPEAEEGSGLTAQGAQDLAVARRLASATGAARDTLICEVERQTNQDVTFAGLQRNASRYTGELAAFTGRVLEIQDIPGGRGSFLRVGVNSALTNVLAVITHLPPADSVVANRRVRVYGRMAGSYSYTSQAGWNITIPRMDAVAVLLTIDAPSCPRPRE